MFNLPINKENCYGVACLIQFGTDKTSRRLRKRLRMEQVSSADLAVSADEVIRMKW